MLILTLFIYTLKVLGCASLLAALIIGLCGARTYGAFLRPPLWGLVLGALGYLAGYLGPIYFTPESNQGPLLGIFITGPAAALLGVVAGTIRSIYLARRRTAPDNRI